MIGAGISGLLAATKLKEAGRDVVILDKGRGVGGRMATRRRDGAHFDHGAQFFTTRDPRFGYWVEQWKATGLVAAWYDYGDSGLHYRAVPSMTAIAKHLTAGGLAVHLETLAAKVERHSEFWRVHDNTGRSWQAKALLLTAPVPQSLALLDAGAVTLQASVRAKLEGILYHRSIAALAVLDQPSALVAHGGAAKLSGEPLQWMGDNQRKGVSAIPAVTIHSTPAFAETHWDSSDLGVPLLLEAAAPHLGAKVVSSHGHRWGFSQPRAAYDREAFWNPELKLAIAGDGLAGGRVEGAAISGIVAAEEIATWF